MKQAIRQSILNAGMEVAVLFLRLPMRFLMAIFFSSLALGMNRDVVAVRVHAEPVIVSVPAAQRRSSSKRQSHISAPWAWQPVYAGGSSPVGVASTCTSSPAPLMQNTAVSWLWHPVTAVV